MRFTGLLVSAGFPSFRSWCIPSSVGSLSPPPNNKNEVRVSFQPQLFSPLPRVSPASLLFQPSLEACVKTPNLIHSTSSRSGFKWALLLVLVMSLLRSHFRNKHVKSVFLGSNSKPVLEFFPKKEIPPSRRGILDDSFSPCMPLSASQAACSAAPQLALDTYDNTLYRLYIQSLIAALQTSVSFIRLHSVTQIQLKWLFMAR